MKLLSLFILLSLNIFSQDLNEIANVLRHVESNNNSKAVGDNGRAIGILQIHKIYVDEVNQRYGTHFKHTDMFNEVRSLKVFTLYMAYAKKYFKHKFDKNPTEQDIVRMHNGGMFTGYKKESTKAYYKKYLRYKQRLRLCVKKKKRGVKS